jgi:putative transcriptional regulator
MIEENKSLLGKILIAQPRNTDGHFTRSVILVAQHSMSGSWGVMVNRPAKTVNMSNVMDAAGIESTSNEAVYVGGPVEVNRVHVVHSMDWSSSSTLQITGSLGITGDRTILAAIAAGEGPRLYRTGIGLAVWSAGQLDGEMSGIEPWTASHQWLTADATLELCLSGSGDEQWQRAINHCVNDRISEFF